MLDLLQFMRDKKFYFALFVVSKYYLLLEFSNFFRSAKETLRPTGCPYLPHKSTCTQTTVQQDLSG